MESTVSFFQATLKSISLAAVRGDRIFMIALFIPFVFLLLFLSADLRLFIFLFLAYSSALMGFMVARSLGLLAQKDLESRELALQQSMLAQEERLELQQTIRQLTLELTQVKERRQEGQMEGQQIHHLMTSHELKEPLRTIRSYIRLLGDRHLRSLNGEGQDFLHYISNAADRMQEMIEDVYAFSSICEGNLRAEPTSLNTVVADTLRMLGGQIRHSRAIIEVDHLLAIQVDKRQFAHLLQNLIENAIKYCDAPIPRIHIKGQQKHGNYLLQVSDNGIGIPSGYHQAIFDLFRRLHGVGEYSGSGIGLAICKKIAENHGGNIWVESEGTGKGASFYISIPNG